MSNARAKAEIYLQEQRLNRLNKNFELQTKEVERRYRHEDWMEEQKRNLFLTKVNDLASPGGTLNTSADIKDINWQLKPTTLLNTVKLDVEENDKEEQPSLVQEDRVSSPA